MKCPACFSEMTRINAGGDHYYWQCEKCGQTMGRPEPQTIDEILDDITKEEAK